MYLTGERERPPVDVEPVRALLAAAEVAAYVGSFARWDHLRGVYTGQGAVVFVYGHGRDARSDALDALLEAGYTVYELHGGTIQVDLPVQE